jgi:hypothetical protein
MPSGSVTAEEILAPDGPSSLKSVLYDWVGVLVSAGPFPTVCYNSGIQPFSFACTTRNFSICL